MTKTEMTEENIKRLEELNAECKLCIEIALENHINIDRKKCLMCSVGNEVHRLSPDNIDGHNSGRYEKYFTA